MSFGRRTIPRPLVASAATVAVVLGLAAVPVGSSADPSLGQLKSQLNAEQGHEPYGGEIGRPSTRNCRRRDGLPPAPPA